MNRKTNKNVITYEDWKITMIIVSGEVVLVNKQVMVSVQFPEFAVDHVEMLVTVTRRNVSQNTLFV